MFKFLPRPRSFHMKINSRKRFERTVQFRVTFTCFARPSKCSRWTSRRRKLGKFTRRCFRQSSKTTKGANLRWRLDQIWGLLDNVWEFMGPFQRTNESQKWQCLFGSALEDSGLRNQSMGKGKKFVGERRQVRAYTCIKKDVVGENGECHLLNSNAQQKGNVGIEC